MTKELLTYLLLLSTAFKMLSQIFANGAPFVAKKGETTRKYNHGIEVTSLELLAAS